MLGTKTIAYQAIRDNVLRLTQGKVVCIDPSIGSTSSMPGYAIYDKGTLLASGILPIDPHKPTWSRLQKLSYHIRKLYKEWEPDILVYEDIPSQRYGGGNANAHASLLKAVGVILSISGPEGYVGLLPLSWKKMVRPTYTKGDENDAIEIGWIAITIAHQIWEEEGGDTGIRRRSRRKQDQSEEETDWKNPR